MMLYKAESFVVGIVGDVSSQVQVVDTIGGYCGDGPDGPSRLPRMTFVPCGCEMQKRDATLATRR